MSTKALYRHKRSGDLFARPFPIPERFHITVIEGRTKRKMPVILMQALETQGGPVAAGKVLAEHFACKVVLGDMDFDSPNGIELGVTVEIVKLSPKRRLAADARKWRRGDSNPRPEMFQDKPLHA